MISVINEAEPFESATAAASWEWMVTACNVPASAAIVLRSQTASTALSSIALQPLAAAPARSASLRNVDLVTEKSFFHRVFNGQSARSPRFDRCWRHQRPLRWRRKPRSFARHNLPKYQQFLGKLRRANQLHHVYCIHSLPKPLRTALVIYILNRQLTRTMLVL